MFQYKVLMGFYQTVALWHCGTLEQQYCDIHEPGAKPATSTLCVYIIKLIFIMIIILLIAIFKF